MTNERTITVDLGDGAKLAVVAEQIGPAMVADSEILAKLGTVTNSIGQVSRDVLSAIKSAGPDKATVELGFGVAVEAGQLVALFGKGKGEASIKVTLEWAKSAEGR
jgi:hypothetical protein